MDLILSSKDNICKNILEDVACFTLEGETLLVVFRNGRTRNYPLRHLWYYESHVDHHQGVAQTADSEVGTTEVVYT